MKVEYGPLFLPFKEVEIRQFNWSLLMATSFLPFPLGTGRTESGDDACVAIWKVKQLKTNTV